ncbi:tRNA(Arg) A34 adenosine deaminase TadA [Saccharothrix carnea]|uniref:tRNA(Arg) A34 adenosine deaminase TadA n=1 Tax=Saccharothrix carnea TaxID=1280637 RepID=A0A2P8I4L7_SACCR|nr:nucleoside deaminase [Saccharothrix carnea]PSL53419.1 tRNA(Arg) A34 adenosine deaminase TadA [Saccharothrix carnea]
MTTSVSPEHAWLRESIELATRNVAEGGGPFGAVIIRAGEVIATGTNQVTPTLDPTAHAEVVAIRAACQAIGDFRLTGCVLVSSCEPCPLCLSAALWARVDRVVYAADRHDAATAGFDDREFYELFGRPRETWSMPVRQVSTGEATAPFAAWLSRTDRVDY